MGIGYSVLACALWPMVAMVIPEHQLGTAYGVMQAVQNLGLAVVPLIAGAINDHGGFIMSEVFFLICMCRKYLKLFTHISLLMSPIITLWFPPPCSGHIISVGSSSQ